MYICSYIPLVCRSHVYIYIIYNGSLAAIPILVISSFRPRIRQETPSVAPSKLSVAAVAAATGASWAIYNNIISTLYRINYNIIYTTSSTEYYIYLCFINTVYHYTYIVMYAYRFFFFFFSFVYISYNFSNVKIIS